MAIIRGARFGLASWHLGGSKKKGTGPVAGTARRVLRTTGPVPFFLEPLRLLALSVAAALGGLMAAGCSTAPCADFLDFCSPGRYPNDANAASGGVCIPQGGPAGGALGGPPPITIGLPSPNSPFGPTGAADTPPPAPISQTLQRPAPW